MKRPLDLTTLTLCTIITLIISSCKKNKEEPVTYPLNFYGERIEVASNTRMFTKDGEIKDPQKIAKFTTTDFEYFLHENNQSGWGELLVTLTSKEKASFTGTNEKYDIFQSGSQYLYKSEKQFQIPKTGDLTYYIFQHREVIGEMPLPSSPSLLIVKDVRVSYGNSKEMRFPLLAYATSSGVFGQQYSKNAGISNNEFNEAALSRLKTNDTLAVKAYMVVCKVK